MTTKNLSKKQKPVKVCLVLDCDNKRHSKEFCSKHYARFKKWGDPLALSPNLHKSLKERFTELVIIPLNDNQCWGWKGQISSTGYSRLASRTSFSQYAHRISWYLHYNEIPTNFVLHRCDNPICTNPQHLFLGTHQDNMFDRQNKNRQAKGEKSGVSKLTIKQVVEIKQLLKKGERRVSISKKYGMSVGAIAGIKSGKNWKHVEI